MSYEFCQTVHISHIFLSILVTGCFDTENEAVDILIDEVEIMETAETLRELADVGS